MAIRELGLTRAPLDREDVAQIDAAGGADRELGVAIERLSPEERHAILERIVLERHYAQIASDARRSEPVIRKRVSRGLARLRDTMGVKT